MTLAALAYRVVLSQGWQRRLIAAGAGALSSLAMAPYNLWPVLAITLPIFVWLLDGTGTGRSGFDPRVRERMVVRLRIFSLRALLDRHGVSGRGRPFRLVAADRGHFASGLSRFFHRLRRGHRALSVDAGTEPAFLLSRSASEAWNGCAAMS